MRNQTRYKVGRSEKLAFADLGRYVNQTRYKVGRSARAALRVLLPAVGVAACDFTVTNPGPVEDTFLNAPTAHTGVVNGAGRDLAEALNWTAYTGAALAREIHPAGSTGAHGIPTRAQIGILAPDEVNEHWMLAQRARWTAEDGARRFLEAVGEAEFDRYPPAAQILLYAGYANRHLGENFCDAIFNNGPVQPNAAYFERAEAHFTQALQIAQAANRPEIATAARAGRASVRMYLGDWAGAVEDASTVPSGFRYAMPYYATTLDLYNRVHEASRGQPYRAHTVWATANEDYFAETRDPRVAYVVGTGSEELGDGAVVGLGRVPFYRQMKHPDRSSAINLSTGREMRLIEAEYMLRQGDWQGAIDVVNELRATLGVETVPQITASDLAEAWTRLKRERGIELWLESRRLGDLRRWKESNTPGALDPLETVGNPRGLPLQQQDLCFPISENERQTNPNLRG